MVSKASGPLGQIMDLSIVIFNYGDFFTAKRISPAGSSGSLGLACEAEMFKILISEDV